MITYDGSTDHYYNPNSPYFDVERDTHAHDIPLAPFNIGDTVRVARHLHLDSASDGFRTSHPRSIGIVTALRYDPSIGTEFPTEPLIIVEFPPASEDRVLKGSTRPVRAQYWADELVSAVEPDTLSRAKSVAKAASHAMRLLHPEPPDGWNGIEDFGPTPSAVKAAYAMVHRIIQELGLSYGVLYQLFTAWALRQEQQEYPLSGAPRYVFLLEVLEDTHCYCGDASA